MKLAALLLTLSALVLLAYPLAWLSLSAGCVLALGLLWGLAKLRTRMTQWRALPVNAK